MSLSHSGYYDEAALEQAVTDGRHREMIGGLWDEIGIHQLAYLTQRGMTPQSRLLDVGCGSLRLGARAIALLDAERYFGTDLSRALIEAGRARELDDSLRAKAPESHFHVGGDFDFAFLGGQRMDFAIAQSVFTHLPLNHLRRCLARLRPVMAPGGQFLVTYFDCPEDADLFAPLTHPRGGIVTHDYQDPYHYRLADLAWVADQTGWRLEPVGDWGHPRSQSMAVFHPA